MGNEAEIFGVMDNKNHSMEKVGEQASLLPDFCDVRVLFILVLMSQMLAIIISLAGAPRYEDVWNRLGMVSLFVQWVALTGAAVLCFAKFRMRRLSPLGTAIASYFLLLMVTLLVSLLALALINISSENGPLTSGWFWGFLLRNMIISAIVCAVILRYFYIQHQSEMNIRAQSRAQIQALQARIHPHFLFNSMNTIASLIITQPEDAEKAVEDLSDLFRASLSGNSTNSLSEEIHLTRSYLDIERLRLGGRLNVVWQNDQLPGDPIEVPALCLQPLVENAIYHGIEPLPEGGVIHIKIYLEDNFLCMSVSNPVGSGEILQHKGNRMAQENIRQRLRLAYQERAAFIIEEESDRYTVTVKIPLESGQ